MSVFLLSMLLCTILEYSVLEYFTSWFLEFLWGIRWWDYSGHVLNLNGRVCLLGAVVFGLGGTALVCLFLPFYEKLFHNIPLKWKGAVCLLLLLIFIADGARCAMKPNTGIGITSSSESSAFFR